VALSEIHRETVHLSELINHTQNNAAAYGIYSLKGTDCLANIIIGTEIWHGGLYNLCNNQAVFLNMTNKDCDTAEDIRNIT